ncbi:MAG: nitrous oxide reductase accessory protein NosL [Gemmatimonadetes bacterium]|nr:nitrous oxide reductase accessory protein NosL [Gemmatimonadota bacterium]
MRRDLATALLTLALAACAAGGPRPIGYGAEPCEHCHMTISDPRFAAEARTEGGRLLVFDDVGCLAAWLQGAPGARGWVVSYVDQASWLPADSAVYLRTDTLRTPMASGLVALRPGAEADSVRAALGGTLLTWGEVLSAAPADHQLGHGS